MKKLNDRFGLQKSKVCLSKSKLGVREYHNSIKPIKATIPIIPNNFGCMDIETMKFKNAQTPVLMSLVSDDDKHLFNI